MQNFFIISFQNNVPLNPKMLSKLLPGALTHHGVPLASEISSSNSFQTIMTFTAAAQPATGQQTPARA